MSFLTNLFHKPTLEEQVAKRRVQLDKQYASRWKSAERCLVQKGYSVQSINDLKHTYFNSGTGTKDHILRATYYSNECFTPYDFGREPISPFVHKEVL